MQLGQLAQQLARILVARIRRLYGHFHNLIPALIGARIQHALLPQPEALPLGSSLRNLEQRAAIDGGHLDLGPQRRLPHRDGYLDFDIVPLAVEERVLLHFGGDIQVPWRRSHGSRVALARHPQSRAVARPRRNPRLHRLRARYPALTAAFRACVPQFPRASAPRARQVELHGSGHLRHVARPLALSAHAPARAGDSRTRPAARAAHVVARDIQTHLGALDGLPEVDVHDVFKVAALFRFRLLLVGRAMAPEKLREYVPEPARVRAPARAAPRAAPRPGKRIRKIEAVEIHARLRAAPSRTSRPCARESA